MSELRMFKKPLEITKDIQNRYNYLLNKMLLHRNSQLFLMTDIKYETKKIVKRKKTIEKLYVVGITLEGWNGQLNFWGIHDAETARYILYYYDLTAMRKRFVDNIKDPLSHFGVNFDIKNKENE